jgi:DNA invertase Pin-like site-specific DNA recombinase
MRCSGRAWSGDCNRSPANFKLRHYQIYAAVAEKKRAMISTRTKIALAAAKAGGVKLGRPKPAEALAKSSFSVKANADALAGKIQPERAKGLSLRAMAMTQLNRLVSTTECLARI